MKNVIKYIVVSLIVTVMIVTSLTNIEALNYTWSWGGNRASWTFSDSGYVYPSHKIKMKSGDSLYYNGVVVTSGTGGGGIAASDNITFTGRDSTTDLWRFGDSVRFYDHVLFKDTLKVSNAIAIFDSAKISVDVSMLSDSSGINWTSGGLSQIYQLPSPASILAFKQNEFDFFTKKGNQILYLDSLNGMTLNYGVYTGNGSGLTSVDAITLKGQDTSKFARTDTLITEDIKGKWNFWDIVSFITIPTIPSFFQNAGRTIQYFLPNSASDTLLTRSQTQTITNKTISASSNTISNISRIIPFNAAVLTTWADSTTYYFGNYPSISPSTTEATHKFYMPCAGSIKGCILSVYKGGTAGSAQNVTIYLRINGSDNLVTSTMQWTTASNYDLATNYSLNIPFVAGDYLTFKIITPNWTPTNPLNCMVSATIYYE